MPALLLAPAAIASLLLAAHFYRAGALWGVVLAAVVLALPLVCKPWAARATQIGLALGAVEWLRTLATFAAVRISLGQPFLRLSLILAAVALVTALAALAFESRTLRARYGLARRDRAAT